jgi:hypothetical protein
MIEIAYIFISYKIALYEPGSEAGWEEERGSGGEGAEMTQTMYAHVNK